MEKNLTSGSVFKNIVLFSLPYLLSYFLQTLYGMADLFIVGQFNGVDSITAVSVGSQVMHMLTVMIVGLAMGSTVVIGKAIGAQKKDQAAEAIGNTIVLFMAVAAVLTLGLLLCVDPIVRVMSTPEEAVSGTVAYLKICFMGIPFITAYNIISSVFRGMGDSKSPMYFIAVACGVNIVLDYVFIGGLHLGPTGAALGTVLSQTVSVIVSMAVIRRRKTGLRIRRDNFCPKENVMRQILKVGIPVALQDGFIQIAFIVITVIVNQRGLLSTVSALSAQNIGAGKPERAVKTLKYAVCITVGFGLVVSVLTQFISVQAVGVFTEDAEVAILGGQYLRSYIWDCMLAGVHFCFSGYFCALGMAGISFLHNSISIVCIRIPGVWLASRLFPNTLYPMGLASPAGSLLSGIICIAAFLYLQKRRKGRESGA